MLLSMMLPARANRATNLVVASLFIPICVFNAVGASWEWAVYYGVLCHQRGLVCELHSGWCGGDQRHGADQFWYDRVLDTKRVGVVDDGDVHYGLCVALQLHALQQVDRVVYVLVADSYGG